MSELNGKVPNRAERRKFGRFAKMFGRAPRSTEYMYGIIAVLQREGIDDAQQGYELALARGWIKRVGSVDIITDEGKRVAKDFIL